MTSTRFLVSAIDSAATVVRRLVSEDAAAVFRSLVELAGGGDPSRSFTMSEAGELSGFGADPIIATARTVRAETVFHSACGLRLIDLDARPLDLDAEHESGLSLPQEDRFCISDRLRVVLQEPFPSATPTESLPVADASTAAWLATVQAAAEVGSGQHFVLRCSQRGDQEIADIAGLLSAGVTHSNCRPVRVATGSMAEVLLRSEIHAGERGPIILVGSSLLIDQGVSPDDFVDEAVHPENASVSLNSHARRALDLLSHLRCTYIWRVPDEGAIPREFDGVIAGCIGPLTYDSVWSAGLIAAMAPGIGHRGTQSILAELEDPRLASPMVAAARARATVDGADFDDAVSFVARSFGGRPGGRPMQLKVDAFDPRLFVADHDGQMLLDNATSLARHGGRILLHGPAGGGKTTFALELARRMAATDGIAARPVLSLTPASILRKSWGEMERLLERVWLQAATQGAIIWVDELDALCGRRDPSETGGNAALVRSLTNEFIRNFDAHTSVPFIAAVNELGTIDASVRRRFAFVISVGDDLPPDRELVAWTSLVGAAPPAGWRPVGASVSDVALAMRRCRMLGLEDPASIADAIARARMARVGNHPRSVARRSIH